MNAPKATVPRGTIDPRVALLAELEAVQTDAIGDLLIAASRDAELAAQERSHEAWDALEAAWDDRRDAVEQLLALTRDRERREVEVRHGIRLAVPDDVAAFRDALVRLRRAGRQFGASFIPELEAAIVATERAIDELLESPVTSAEIVEQLHALWRDLPTRWIPPATLAAISPWKQ